MSDKRREKVSRGTGERGQRPKSRWVLVDVQMLPISPQVQRVMDEWLGQEIWFLTPWKQWRRGKVKFINNLGDILVVVYQKGTPGGVEFAFAMKSIPILLRHVEK